MEVHDYGDDDLSSVPTSGAKTQRMQPRVHVPIPDLSVWLADGAGLDPQ